MDTAHIEAVLVRLGEQLNHLTGLGTRLENEVAGTRGSIVEFGNRQADTEGTVQELITIGVVRPEGPGAGEPADGNGGPDGPPQGGVPRLNGEVPQPNGGPNQGGGDHPGGVFLGVPGTHGVVPPVRILMSLKREGGWKPLRQKKGYFDPIPMYSGKASEWCSFNLKLSLVLDELYGFTYPFLGPCEGLPLPPPHQRAN